MNKVQPHVAPRQDGALEFLGIAGLAAEIAKVLFVVFLVLFVMSLVAGRRPPV